MILTEALDIQMGVDSMYEFSGEELLSAIMEGQGIDIQKHANDNDTFSDYYQEMVAAGYIDSEELIGKVSKASSTMNGTIYVIGSHGDRGCSPYRIQKECFFKNFITIR